MTEEEQEKTCEIYVISWNIYRIFPKRMWIILL